MSARAVATGAQQDNLPGAEGQLGPAGARFGLFWTVETRTTPPGRRGKVVGGDWEGGRWSHLTHLALGRPLCAAPAPPGVR